MKLTTHIQLKGMLNLSAVGGCVALIVAFIPASARAQNAVIGTPESNQIFVARCGGCHGADARGSDRGPALAEVRRLRTRSVQQLRDIIQKGIPGTGMPPFDLPAAELDALAALVRSLNGPAAESMVSGDPAAGEQYFFGQGQCASCHMVHGKGQPSRPGFVECRKRNDGGTDSRSFVAAQRPHHPGLRTGHCPVARWTEPCGDSPEAAAILMFACRTLDGKFHLLQEGQILTSRVKPNL